MDVDVTATTVEPTPTAVVAAAVTWAEFPQVWRPMLDQVWSFLRSGAAAALRGRALRPELATIDGVGQAHQPTSRRPVMSWGSITTTWFISPAIHGSVTAA